MRALTVRQPWAWALIHGGKDVENRSRNLAGTYRGPVAIHAGLTIDEDALDDYLIDTAWEDAYGWGPASDGHFEVGAFIGVVELVSVHHHDAHGSHYLDRCSQWAQRGQWHLKFENPRSLGFLTDPIQAKGKLGLWHPDEADVAAIYGAFERIGKPYLRDEQEPTS